MSKDKIIIDGKKIAREIEEKVAAQISQIQLGLATVLVGDDKPSGIYAKLIRKASERVGILPEHHELSKNTKEKDLIELIESLNRNERIHGILIHRPLPKQIDERKIIAAISPEKDVDGSHPSHLGRTLMGIENIIPCAPHAAITILERHRVKIRGKNAVVVGHSLGVGKPMVMLLLNRNATVTVCHIHTENLPKYTREADILATAAGVKNLIKGDMVKKGAAVLDIGGDIDFDIVVPKASLITPTPGGIGPVTVALLMENTVKLALSNSE
ncbi:MAG: bifunctional 5,10-methylenetetrahydrofolate dehydrogenase/5,10-methenyltetrahydrofolate cyclohydrolase [Euryarchaeota archaeon]|nr:bifunctional 5,10-methylenetetrahydrofolate dehydrogenase/5,10-methenyltetrahydrofolate cyclohydrolase [Euryarchaeota archaeon]